MDKALYTYYNIDTAWIGSGVTRPFKKDSRYVFSWTISPLMREFVYHLAGNIEYCSATSLLHRAVIHYAKSEHKISYHEYVKDLRLDTPDEMRLQLLLKDQRTKSLQQENAELRYQLKELKKSHEHLISGGFRQS